MVDAQRVRSIFLEAVEHHAPDQFLDQACGGDKALRKRVELLLRAHDQANSVLDLALNYNGLGRVTGDEGVGGPGGAWFEARRPRVGVLASPWCAASTSP